MQVRTRFAPSPTGSLHVGGARTALFAWLFARHYQGTFILRIEDTDLERSTPESVKAILDGMEWLNLAHDEGPFYQTQRFDRYREVLDQLLAEGKAYRCYCSKERLESLRESQLAQQEKPRYDGHCRHLPEDTSRCDPYVVRFKTPEQGSISFDDLVRGPITIANSELDDLILARSEGTPTYNFTVVVDDWDMAITHVLRGDDHINNTPRQIHLFEALGVQPPIYGHVPMILGSDGKRLSKRHGADSVMDYERMGILPEALINYLVRLGWSHGDQEIFSRDELISLFDGTNLSSAPAALNPDKLLWLNQHYMKTLSSAYVGELLGVRLAAIGVDVKGGPDLSAVVAIQAERTKTLVEMAERSRYFFEDAITWNESAVQKHLTVEARDLLQQLHTVLHNVMEWTPATVHAALVQIAEAAQVGLGKVAQPVRVAVTGDTVSPPIDVTLALIGRERVLMRLTQVMKGG